MQRRNKKHGMRKRKWCRRRGKYGNIIITILLLAAITAICGTVLFLRRTEKPRVAIPRDEIKQKADDEEIQPGQESAYRFRTEEVEIRIRDLSRPYMLAWVSDLHMITDREVSADIQEEDLFSLQERYDALYKNLPALIPTEPSGKHGEDLWPELIIFLNNGIDGQKFDGIILGGDIVDYCSSANISYVQEGLDALDPEVPVLYIRADHDYGYGYGGEGITEETTHALQAALDGDNLEEKILDFEEFMVIGVNESTRNLNPEQMRIIREQMEAGKPVILASHVPFSSRIAEEEQRLAALSMEVRQTIYYWGGERYAANAVTQELLEKIYWEHTPVKLVVAGHLHAEWDGMLTEKVSQHIFSPSFSGTVGVIHILPKEG